MGTTPNFSANEECSGFTSVNDIVIDAPPDINETPSKGLEGGAEQLPFQQAKSRNSSASSLGSTSSSERTRQPTGDSQCKFVLKIMGPENVWITHPQ